MTINTSLTMFFLFFTILVLSEVFKYLNDKRKEEEQAKENKKELLKGMRYVYDIIEQEIQKGSNTGGEDYMSDNKSLSVSEYGMGFGRVIDVPVNEKSLTDLLEVRAEDEDYEEVLNVLIRYINKLYGDYKFKLMKPQEGDFRSGYALTFLIDNQFSKDILEALFKMAVDKGLSEEVLSNKFAEKVKEGKVIDLGDAIIVGSGLSSIVSGEPINVFIAYETPEYKEKRLEAEEEQKAKEDEYAKEQEKQYKLRAEAHKALAEASLILKEMNKEMVEKNPQYLEAYEKLKELYQ